MTKESYETDLAVKALARRLYDWGVKEGSATKARLYIDELTTRGWKPDLVNISRRPPRREEECRLHAGEYEPPNCRGCASEKAGRRDAEEDARIDHDRRSVAEHVEAAKAAIRANRPTPPVPAAARDTTTRPDRAASEESA